MGADGIVTKIARAEQSRVFAAEQLALCEEAAIGSVAVEVVVDERGENESSRLKRCNDDEAETEEMKGVCLTDWSGKRQRRSSWDDWADWTMLKLTVPKCLGLPLMAEVS